jgi:hypothetical protein
MARDLIEFTRRAFEAGATREQITETLAQAGWVRSDIDRALNAFAPIPFPIPVPKPKTHLSARDSFVYLLLFTSLYVSLWSVISLIFDLINRFVPDPLQVRSTVGLFAENSLRWNVALLLVMFPLFGFMFRMVGRSEALYPAQRMSGPRTWLSYLTLFTATVVVVGDIASLIYNLLGGELTLRFVLKVLTVGLMAGGVLLFFVFDLRADDTE